MQRIDATLSAADLVICQTGCTSHDAYGRVKDHCKRSGKPCICLDKPGAGSCVRAPSTARETAAPWRATSSGSACPARSAEAGT